MSRESSCIGGPFSERKLQLSKDGVLHCLSVLWCNRGFGSFEGKIIDIIYLARDAARACQLANNYTVFTTLSKLDFYYRYLQFIYTTHIYTCIFSIFLSFSFNYKYYKKKKKSFLIVYLKRFGRSWSYLIPSKPGLVTWEEATAWTNCRYTLRLIRSRQSIHSRPLISTISLYWWALRCSVNKTNGVSIVDYEYVTWGEKKKRRMRRANWPLTDRI